MRKYLDLIVRSIMAGSLISLGGCVLLMSDNKYIGAFLFTLGLLSICAYKLNLYTGKVSYVFENKPSYIIDLIIILIFNFLGALIIGGLLYLTNVSGIRGKALELVEMKMNYNWYTLIILSALCGVMVYMAVEGFKRCPHYVGKIVFVIMPIMLFILAKFEHSIANMFYVIVSGNWTINSFVMLLLSILGNSIGAIICCLLGKALIKEGKNE